MGAWIQKLLKGGFGWKTIGAAVALVVLVIAESQQWITVEQFERFTKVAEALGFVGLRDAFSKIKQG